MMTTASPTEDAGVFLKHKHPIDVKCVTPVKSYKKKNLGFGPQFRCLLPWAKFLMSRSWPHKKRSMVQQGHLDVPQLRRESSGMDFWCIRCWFFFLAMERKMLPSMYISCLHPTNWSMVKHVHFNFPEKHSGIVWTRCFPEAHSWAVPVRKLLQNTCAPTWPNTRKPSFRTYKQKGDQQEKGQSKKHLTGDEKHWNKQIEKLHYIWIDIGEAIRIKVSV